MTKCGITGSVHLQFKWDTALKRRLSYERMLITNHADQLMSRNKE